jgi:hypothetical protein
MKVLGGKIEDDKAYFGGKNKGKREVEVVKTRL